MTNNGTSNIANYSNITYDSGHDKHNGHHRVATSATEIELLNDLPPAFGAGTTTSENDKQRQSNNYHTLSLNREAPTANVAYQDEHDQQLNYAVDKLLNRYAPDAAPQNLVHTTVSRQLPPQINVSTGHNEPLVSSFQTNIPPSTTTTAPSNSYSSIIRPNTGQISQPQSQPHVNQNTSNRVNQSSAYTRPQNHYDNFQHSIPQTQQPQQPQQSKPAIPIKTIDGLVTQVVPGKLYTLDDDPLHLLYDRQDPIRPNQKQQQQSSFQSTFQPSMNVQHIQEPLSSSSATYTNTSQRYPHQPTSIKTDPTNIDHMQSFDLGNLIKRVQEDYLREIQPFVSSVKFVEKDKEFGQNLNDIGLTTPVAVRKGFTRQADDILRNSFGGKKHQRRSMNQPNSNKYSDDDVDELRSTGRHNPLQKFDSKQSFTSVTSTSSYESDYDDRGVPANQGKKKVAVHDQGTSPPPRQHQMNTRTQGSQPFSGSTAVSSKPFSAGENNRDGGVTQNSPGNVKPAKRISSSQRSISSSGSSESGSDDNYTSTYYDPEPKKSNQGASAVVTNTPVIQPTSAARDRALGNNQGPQHSEDIRPVPPTIRSNTNSQKGGRDSASERTSSIGSRSSQVTDSDDDRKSPAPINPVTPTTTSRTNVQQNLTTTPGGRSAAVPVTNSRDAVAAGGAPAARNAPATNSRDAVAAGGAPVTNSRDAVAAGSTPAARNAPATNSRDAVAAGGAPTTNSRDAVAAGGAPAARNPPTTNSRDAVAAGGAPVPNSRDTVATGGAPARNPPVTNSRDTVAAGGAPAPNSRDTVAAGGAPAARNPPTTNSRDAVAAGGAPAPNSRDTVAAGGAPAARNPPTTNSRDTVAAGANPNIHFVPPDQRNAAGAGGAQAASNQPNASSTTAANTGSTRLFHTDHDPKGKRSLKDAPAAVGNKIKSLFRRK